MAGVLIKKKMVAHEKISSCSKKADEFVLVRIQSRAGPQVAQGRVLGAWYRTLGLENRLKTS